MDNFTDLSKIGVLRNKYIYAEAWL